MSDGKDFQYNKTDPKLLVGILIGTWPEGFPEGQKKDAPEKALAELRCQRIGVKKISSLAGEMVSRRLFESLPFTISELAEALSLPFAVSVAVWARLSAGEIDPATARNILGRLTLLPAGMRNSVRGILFPIVKRDE